MNVFGAGVVLALLIAGWPLYSMVSSGELEPDSALLRGGVIAFGCAIGVTALIRLALSYEAQSQAQAQALRQRTLDELYSTMESVVDDGSLTEEHAENGSGTGSGTGAGTGNR